MYSIMNKTHGDGVVLLSGKRQVLHAGESILSAIKPASMTRGLVCVDVPVVKKQNVVRITPTPVSPKAVRSDRHSKTDREGK